MPATSMVGEHARRPSAAGYRAGASAQRANHDACVSDGHDVAPVGRGTGRSSTGVAGPVAQRGLTATGAASRRCRRRRPCPRRSATTSSCVVDELGVVAGEVLASGGDQPPVQRQHRRRRRRPGDSTACSPQSVRLRQPRRRGRHRPPRTRGRAGGRDRPRQRDAAAVAADCAAAGAGEHRDPAGRRRGGRAPPAARAPRPGTGRPRRASPAAARPPPGPGPCPTARSTGPSGWRRLSPVHAAGAVTASWPSRVTMRWVSWLLSANVGQRPAGRRARRPR